MKRLSRRALLKAAGGVSVALPLLPSLARAEDTPYPRRLIIFYHPNGTLPSAWWPTNVLGETQFTLNRIHQPLEPFKKDLVLLKGIDLKSCERGPGEPHQRGMGGVLVGRQLLPGNFVGGDGSLAGWGSGISLDQYVAQQIGGKTKEPSLQLGVRVSAAEVRTRMSYLGPSQPLPPQVDPRQVFTQLFSEFPVDAPVLEQLRRRRKSVLDAVIGQFSALNPRLSAADRQKLDQHLTMVRDMESRLELMGGPTASPACVLPEAPPDLEPDSEATMPKITRLQLDLLVMAMACDLTRVGSVMLCGAIDAIAYPWLGSYYDGHTLSHLGDSDPQKPQIITRDSWTAEQLAYLLGRLKGIKEGAGTMLDNTLVLWTSEISVGNSHSQLDMPFVLAGRAGGLRTGRYLQYTGASHNDLLVSILHAMGIRENTFGDPAYCKGPLPGLLSPIGKRRPPHRSRRPPFASSVAPSGA